MDDLSDNWKAPGIAAQQRAVVDWQLKEMQAGRAPRHFAVVGDILQTIRQATQWPHAAILDAGCSSGYYYDVLEHYVPGWLHYVGIDYSTEMVELARRHHPVRAMYEVRDIFNLPWRDGRFQIVLSGATVNHVSDWKAALAEVCRICGFHIILHRAWIGKETECREDVAYGQRVYQWYWTQEDLLAEFQANSFELEEARLSGEGEQVWTFWMVRR